MEGCYACTGGAIRGRPECAKRSPDTCWGSKREGKERYCNPLRGTTRLGHTLALIVHNMALKTLGVQIVVAPSQPAGLLGAGLLQQNHCVSAGCLPRGCHPCAAVSEGAIHAVAKVPDDPARVILLKSRLPCPALPCPALPCPPATGCGEELQLQVSSLLCTIDCQKKISCMLHTLHLSIRLGLWLMHRML